MITVVDVAQAVVALLAGKAQSEAPFSLPVRVDYDPLPAYEPADLKDLRITVAPWSFEQEPNSRSTTRDDFAVTLGIQKKTTSEPEEFDSLMAFAAEVVAFLKTSKHLGGAAAGLVWMRTVHDPLYHVPHLREGIFTSVLTVTYRGVQ